MLSEYLKNEVNKFYKAELEGKTDKELQSIIHSLKKKIGRMKNIVEHPEFEDLWEDETGACLFMSLLYLDETKRAFTELGGKYKLSAAERKAENFEKNISHIVRIEAQSGNNEYGYINYFFDLSKDIISAEYSHHGPIDRWPHGLWETYDKEQFLENLKDIRVGTWRRRYTLERFNYDKYDEIPWYDNHEWWVKFYYDNGKRPVKFEGNRAFPYNFSELSSLLNLLPIDVPKEVRLAQIEKDQKKRCNQKAG